jgi:hypothetical protein
MLIPLIKLEESSTSTSPKDASSQQKSTHLSSPFELSKAPPNNFPPLHYTSVLGTDLSLFLFLWGLFPSLKQFSLIYTIITFTDSIHFSLSNDAYLGNVDATNALLKLGVPLETSDREGNTALHWAARADQTAIIELLVRHGGSSLKRSIRLTELCNQNGDTPLHVAVIEGHYDAVHTLIQCGSSLNRQNLDGLTPLHAAVLIGNTFTCSHYFMDCEIDY